MSIAVDGQSVYWSERTGVYAFKKCPKTGCTGPATLISSTNGGDGLLFDSASGNLFLGTSGINVVSSFNVAGTLLFQVQATNQVTSVAVDANNLYWNAGSSIVRAAKDGTGPVTIADALPSYIQGTMAVDAAASMIYATCPGDAGSIVRTPTTGSAVNAWTIFGPPSQKNPTSVIVAGNNVYWTTRGIYANGTYNDGGVYMCPKSGCTQATVLLGSASYAASIVADATNVYFIANNNVYRCPLAGCGGAPTTLSTGTAGNFGGPTLTLDDKAIYWLPIGGPVMKLAK
jgi:hypothetical protein